MCKRKIIVVYMNTVIGSKSTRCCSKIRSV